MDPVRNFVCKHFGTTNENDIKVWGPNPTHTWQTASEHHITANFTFDKPLDASIRDGEAQVQTTLLGNLQEIEGDLNPLNRNVQYAGIYGITGIRARSSYPFHMTFRTNYIHPSMIPGMEEQHRLQVEGGGIKGAVFHVNPHTESVDVNAPFLGIRNFHYQQPDFVKSMATVCPENLMNGIFMIPREICVQCNQKVFPVWRPEEPHLQECEELQDKLLFWYFVPPDHVMAWPFHAPPEYRKQQQWNVLEYRVQDTETGVGKLLGFLVCNRTLNRAKRSFLRTFMGKVHISDLRDVDIQAVPAMNMIHKDATNPPPTQGIYEGMAQVRVRIAYFLYDTLSAEQVVQLCPTFAPTFPNYSQWIITQGLNK